MQCMNFCNISLQNLSLQSVFVGLCYDYTLINFNYVYQGFYIGSGYIQNVKYNLFHQFTLVVKDHAYVFRELISK